MSLFRNILILFDYSALQALLSTVFQSLFFYSPPLHADGMTVLDQTNHIGTDRPEQPGRAYLYDGINDTVTRDRVTTGAVTTLSFFCWVKSTSVASTTIGGEYNLTDNNRQWFCRIMSTGVFNVVISDDGTFGASRKDYSTVAAVNDDEWHLVGFTWNAGDLNLYIDGIEVEVTKTNDGAAVSIKDGNAPYRMGAYTSGGVGINFFDGSQKDPILFSRVLTASEITYLASHGEIGIDPTMDDCLVWWDCEDTHATIAYDKSGDGNDGTKVGITASTFHYEGTDVPRSAQNQVGYSENIWFDGVDDYVDIGDDRYNSQNTGSMEAWVYFSDHVADGVEEYIVSQASDTNGNAYLLMALKGVGGSTRLYCGTRIGADYITGDTDLDANTWHKVKFSSDGAVWSLEVNDSPESFTVSGTNTGAWFQDMISGTMSYLIGARKRLGVVSNWFNGFIRDVSIESGGTWELKNDYEDSSGLGHHATNVGTTALLIPRDESNPTKDVLGADLDYVGRVPRDAELVNSPCATLDGVDDYIEVASDGTGVFDNQQGSIACWVLPYTDSNQYFLWSYDFTSHVAPHYAQHLRIEANMDIESFFNDGAALTVGPSYTAGSGRVGTWMHIVLTFENGSQKLYLDGELVDETNLTDTISYYAQECWIANGNYAGQDSASMMDWRYYDDVLTGDEVKWLYDGNGTDPGRANLLRHFPMSEGAGTTHYDCSDNAQPATANGISAGSYWGTTQDVYHYDVNYGHSPSMNLIPRSNDLSHAFWTKTRCTVGVSSESAPQSGLGSVYEMTPTGASTHYIADNINVVSGNHFHSVYAKLGSGTQLVGVCILDTSQGDLSATFNLVTGVATGIGDTVTDQGMEDVGNGWYRCWCKGQPYVSGTSPFAISPWDGGAASKYTGSTYTADGSTIHVWAPQSDRSATLRNYLPTSGTSVESTVNVPAIAGLDQAGLPVEYPATNGLNTDYTDINFTPEADAPWVSKVYDGHAAFDGVDGIIESTVPAPVYPFELEGTFVSNTGGTLVGTIASLSSKITTGRYFYISYYSDTLIQVIRRNVTTDNYGFATPDDPGEHTIRVVFNSATAFDIYYDGELAESLTGQTSIAAHGSMITFGVGATYQGSSNTAIELDGTVKEAKYTSSTASESCYWRLKDGHALDYSGNNNHGTPQGGVTFPVTAVETAYTKGDGRTDPLFVTMTDKKDYQFYIKDY